MLNMDWCYIFLYVFTFYILSFEMLKTCVHLEVAIVFLQPKWYSSTGQVVQSNKMFPFFCDTQRNGASPNYVPFSVKLLVPFPGAVQ